MRPAIVGDATGGTCLQIMEGESDSYAQALSRECPECPNSDCPEQGKHGVTDVGAGRDPKERPNQA